jgi:opacity protein-like surface antigen/outer membrane protein OmpA-like peptidoglycan-associated protein
MRFAVRLIATMTLAFVMVPALYADDAAKPNAEATKDEPSASVTAPTAAANVQPNTAETPAVRSSTSRETESEPAAQPAGKVSGSDDPYPKVEWFFGYSFWRAMPTSNDNRMGYLHGGSTSIAYNFNRYLGLAVDFGGYGNSRLTLLTPTLNRTLDSDGSAYTFMAGPRLSYRRYERFTPFAQALFGGAHATSVTVSGCTGFPDCTPLPSETSFATMLGAGFDIKVSHHIALRLFEGDFLLTHFKNAGEVGSQVEGWQKNVRFSSGIVFRFGGNPPPPPPVNHPPIASCSADKSMVYLDSGDVVAVTATAADPDGDPLTYTWTASGGRVDGNGPQVRWLSTGTTAGSYTVTLHVDDGRGGAATCSADIRIEPKPNRPPTIACSANPNSVFAGERSQITCNASDPDGDPLTYTWRANAGRITGNGPAGDYDTTGLSPGTYTITTRVDDGRGGAADASTAVNVKPVPVPPQASKINECLFGKPLSTRIDNVCKRILDDVALRLQSEPRASAVIIGYSDPKERRGDTLAGDRGTNAVKYLGEKGIDASRVTTRTGSGQAGADARNRRIDVIFVPEGATY